MTEITIVGTGNVAFHLCQELSSKHINFQVYGRNKSELDILSKQFKINTFSSISELNQDNLFIVCIKDDEIKKFTSKLNTETKVAYTSGTISLDNFKNRKFTGVFYPLQTFSKRRKINFNEVPILIEANNDEFTNELIELALKISNRVEKANSEKRKSLHLAAVFANNFTNHMLHISKTIMEKNKLDWSLLHPLIKETLTKIIDGENPKEIQTGPAKRKDFKTIEIHLDHLNESESEIYSSITKNIIETDKK
jgi:predicted short-subunit dehydrogenase-like oxidoreductase (DUF2520 family)